MKPASIILFFVGLLSLCVIGPAGALIIAFSFLLAILSLSNKKE